MNNNKEKIENLSVSESDASTVLLDISKLEYNLKRLEALANTSSSDIESEIDFDLDDISDFENLDIDKDNTISKKPITNYQNDNLKTRKYSRYIGNFTPSNGSKSEVSGNSKHSSIENDYKAREVHFDSNEIEFNDISANPRDYDNNFISNKKSTIHSSSENDEVNKELEIMKKECINRENDLRKLREELDTLRKDYKVKDNKLKKLEAEKINIVSNLDLYKEKSDKSEKDMSDLSCISNSSQYINEGESFEGSKYLNNIIYDTKYLAEQLERYQNKFIELKKINEEEKNKSKLYKTRFIEIKKLINQLEIKQKEDKKTFTHLKRSTEKEITNYKTLLQNEQNRCKELEAKLKELKNTQTIYEIEKIKEIENLTLQIRQIENKSKEYIDLIQKEKEKTNKLEKQLEIKEQSKSNNNDEIEKLAEKLKEAQLKVVEYEKLISIEQKKV